MGGKASAASKNKYNAKVYDRINLVVSKGRKVEIQLAAKEQGESMNGFIIKAVKERAERLGKEGARLGNTI